MDNYGFLLEKLRNLGQFDYSIIGVILTLAMIVMREGIAFLTKLPVYEADSFYCSQNKSIHSILSRKIMGLTVFYQDQLIDIYSCHINLPGSEEGSAGQYSNNCRTLRVISGLKILMGILILMQSQTRMPTMQSKSWAP